MVYEGILTMPIIHLTGLRSNLIEFGPCMFSSFAMEMPSIGSVRRRVAVRTVIFVVLYVDEWDKIASRCDRWREVDEVFFESFNGIYVI